MFKIKMKLQRLSASKYLFIKQSKNVCHMVFSLYGCLPYMETCIEREAIDQKKKSKSVKY